MKEVLNDERSNPYILSPVHVCVQCVRDVNESERVSLKDGETERRRRVAPATLESSFGVRLYVCMCGMGNNGLRR